MKNFFKVLSDDQTSFQVHASPHRAKGRLRLGSPHVYVFPPTARRGAYSLAPPPRIRFSSHRAKERVFLGSPTYTFFLPPRVGALTPWLPRVEGSCRQKPTEGLGQGKRKAQAQPTRRDLQPRHPPSTRGGQENRAALLPTTIREKHPKSYVFPPTARRGAYSLAPPTYTFFLPPRERALTPWLPRVEGSCRRKPTEGLGQGKRKAQAQPTRRDLQPRHPPSTRGGQENRAALLLTALRAPSGLPKTDTFA